MFLVTIKNNSDSNIYCSLAPSGYEEDFPMRTSTYFKTEYKKGLTDSFKEYNKYDMSFSYPERSPYDDFTSLYHTISPSAIITFPVKPFSCNGWQEKGYYRITIFIAICIGEYEWITSLGDTIELEIEQPQRKGTNK